MNKAKRFTALCASMFAAVSLFQPTAVISEQNYKNHDITPFALSENELTEVAIDDTGITVSLPSSWEEDPEYECYYPGEEDESICFYYFDSENKKKFEPKKDIDDAVDYFMNEEPKQSGSTLSAVSTDYFQVGTQFIAKTAYNVSVKEDGKTYKWKEINYIIPVNEKYILNINILLDAGKKQYYLNEEEALILTIKDRSKKLFADYIKSHPAQTQTAAISTVRRNTATTTVVSTPVPTPEPAANVGYYVLNTNTMKFHLPNCSSISKMKASNRWDVEMTRDEVIAMGYVPCKKCYP